MFICVALLAAACSEQKESWYDQSKGMQQTKNERIEQFKMQGMDQVTAQKTADFESYWRNTEIGHRGLQPIEYDKDQGAMKY